ncbi:BMP family ABC transporter substrate-binding protein [Candidatus Chloroploca sp. M-50]|uniref:BMP family ABC transporter substrate-binding protein n=1 Tax=Candidatus Chloroploca mongolica TaxID=2528176 RepID=A0ABS4D8Y8_9CHLR|nr:BMP family ABC transporter substrate-binding protein [Candidatus Chloroploca mongolica]MBP1465913.1 BMP family ABC transporter substrate-binding protein [Candidatus Chloroploca mongolica]
MRQPPVRFIALLILFALLLGACGTTPAAQPTAAPAPEATGAPPVAPTDAPAEPTAEATQPTEPPAATEAPTEEEFVFGMILVGPTNDGGWNQAHFAAAEYAQARLPGSRFIYIDKVNPADRPNVQVEQAIEELINQGAKFVITNSAEFADGTKLAAEAHPDVYFLHASGDAVLTGSAPSNLTNLMGRMEYGKMMAGCAAALQSDAGKLAYLGPLIDPETRRLVNSTYLGAKYCWENYRDQPADSLDFKVTWIGFWFNIPGVTLDPTRVATDFINEGNDVIISGIDTTEGLVEANKASAAGRTVWAVPYDYEDACAQGEDVCLGVPYFNWGPRYTEILGDAMEGRFESQWEWIGPDWNDINNPDTSMIGFIKGAGLTPENGALLDDFISKLADGSLNLFTGPLNFQDGTVFVADGEVADDLAVWNTPQLLEGIEGQSAP